MGRWPRRAVRQLDEEDVDGVDDEDAPASAFDRPESELEAASDDGDDESFDADEEPLDDAEEASFSLRRPWATEPWSFL